MEEFRHLKHNHWCRFPRMKCACMDSGNSYERLNTSYIDFGNMVEDKDSSNEKQQELVFCNDDGSYQTVIVEKNLCATDLCQLLALKNRVDPDEDFIIVEHWVDLGLERGLEDHEDVLCAYRDMEGYSKHADCRFVFRKDFRKYEFFRFPLQFFPPDMTADYYITEDGYPRAITAEIGIQEGVCPLIFSHVWVRDAQKNCWSKAFLLLKDKKLYITYKAQFITKFVRQLKSKETIISDADVSGLYVYARLTSYNVYTTLNAKNQFRAPTEWGICLRPTGTDSEDEGGTLKCVACDSERTRTCWVTAMRLAKYGKQLRENYRAFKNKQVESINPKEYNSYTVPNESVRSRVAMDFTGSVGRIVEDPKEAKAIAVAEGYSWKRRWRPAPRIPPGGLQAVECGIHNTQPWFHGGMTRDQAAALVMKHGTVDGVFLVRDSRSNPGCFVLSYRFTNKCFHTQIQPMRDPTRDTHVFTLDAGKTKFYDLLQLVEFYQLNPGVLPTRLTHYVVQAPTGVQLPVHVQVPLPPQDEEPPATASL